MLTLGPSSETYRGAFSSEKAVGSHSDDGLSDDIRWDGPAAHSLI